jgi:hypothetical protein
LYTDIRKDWLPFLGRTVARMEKSSGNTSPGGGDGGDITLSTLWRGIRGDWVQEGLTPETRTRGSRFDPPIPSMAASPVDVL